MNKLEVQSSHRVTVKAKYLGATDHRGSRISVQRYENTTNGKDPNRIIVSWDYALELGENYAQAIKVYLDRSAWGGRWVVSTITDGAVAVCVDATEWGQ